MFKITSIDKTEKKQRNSLRTETIELHHNWNPNIIRGPKCFRIPDCDCPALFDWRFDYLICSTITIYLIFSGDDEGGWIGNKKENINKNRFLRYIVSTAPNINRWSYNSNKYHFRNSTTKTPILPSAELSQILLDADLRGCFSFPNKHLSASYANDEF